MFNQKMIALGEKRSAIRELSEYGDKLAQQIGKENVFNFTIGNPSVPTPDAVNNSIVKNVANPDVHRYTTSVGDSAVREKIAQRNRQLYNSPISAEHIYMTCGAAAGLAISLRAAVCDTQDEVLVFTPFFAEYTVFIENAGGKQIVVPMDETNFQIDFAALEKLLTKRTAAVVVNSPNNPSGIVYSKETLEKLSKILSAAEEKFGTVIVLISDEPYREIVFDGKFETPLNYYRDSVLCYSYSKSFSLPGERIGYLALSDSLTNVDTFYAAVRGAGRSLGYVCAPSIFQYVVGDCADQPSNISPYRQNRDILVESLGKMGFEVVNPQGAFYLLMKVPDGNTEKFMQVAKEHCVLTVPTDSFGLKGYVRIATCVSTDMVRRSLPQFEKIAKILL